MPPKGELPQTPWGVIPFGIQLILGYCVFRSHTAATKLFTTSILSCVISYGVTSHNCGFQERIPRYAGTSEGKQKQNTVLGWQQIASSAPLLPSPHSLLRQVFKELSNSQSSAEPTTQGSPYSGAWTKGPLCLNEAFYNQCS